jgi:hypothetical protein
MNLLIEGLSMPKRETNIKIYTRNGGSYARIDDVGVYKVEEIRDAEEVEAQTPICPYNNFALCYGYRCPLWTKDNGCERARIEISHGFREVSK